MFTPLDTTLSTQLNHLSNNSTYYLRTDGEVIQVRANFDDGALINAMSATKFNEVEQHLGHYKPSSRWLRMANGAIVRAIAVWEGEMEIGGVKTPPDAADSVQQSVVIRSITILQPVFF